MGEPRFPTPFPAGGLLRLLSVAGRVDQDAWHRGRDLLGERINVVLPSAPVTSEHAYLAACFAALSNSAEAEKETAHVLKSNPNFTIEAALERSPYALDSDREHQRETMLKAGLPA